MAKKRISGISLSKQKNSMGKNHTNPEYTDRFIDRVLEQGFEGKEPVAWQVAIGSYKGKEYTIDREGKIRGLNGEEMKYLFYPNKKGPRVRIHKQFRINGEIQSKEVELNVLKLMEKYFGTHFPGYRLAITFPGQYLLVPKDDDFSNLHRSNLVFVDQKAYKEKGTKRAMIKMLFQMFPDASDAEIAQETGFSRPHIYRVRQELIAEGVLNSNARLERVRQITQILVTEKLLPVYEILLEYGEEKENLELAAMLWPQEASQAITDQQKKALTTPIVRVKQKLTDAGILSENGFKKHKETAIAMIRDKKNSGKTNQQIAEILGLKKEQIDNLSRQIKKSESETE